MNMPALFMANMKTIQHDRAKYKNNKSSSWELINNSTISEAPDVTIIDISIGMDEYQYTCLNASTVSNHEKLQH